MAIRRRRFDWRRLLVAIAIIALLGAVTVLAVKLDKHIGTKQSARWTQTAKS